MIDHKIIVPECKRILELMNTITKKTTRKDIKEIANIVSATTREWLYADATLRIQIEFLCISPIGDREHLLNTVDSVKARLNELISDPSDFGKLSWQPKKESKPISHVFTKSENVKMWEALKAKYSQNLDDWL